MPVDAVSLQNEMSRSASFPVSPQERSMATEILIINQCSVLSDANVQAVIPAVQAQVSDDFAPIWKADATLQFLGRGHRVPRGVWPLYLLDHSDQPGALGYHLDEHGRIEGKVFAADDQRYGVSWTVGLTHQMFAKLRGPHPNYLILLPHPPPTLP